MCSWAVQQHVDIIMRSVCSWLGDGHAGIIGCYGMLGMSRGPIQQRVDNILYGLCYW